MSCPECGGEMRPLIARHYDPVCREHFCKTCSLWVGPRRDCGYGQQHNLERRDFFIRVRRERTDNLRKFGLIPDYFGASSRAVFSLDNFEVKINNVPLITDNQ